VVVPIPVLAILIAGGVALTDKDASLIDYRARDDDTIVVTALGGSNWFGTRVHDVRESASTVTVRVRSLEVPLPHSDIGIPYRFGIDLASPLGDRKVVDGFGAEVPLIDR
jgi:hypothetical protein